MLSLSVDVCLRSERFQPLVQADAPQTLTVCKRVRGYLSDAGWERNLRESAVLEARNLYLLESVRKPERFQAAAVVKRIDAYCFQRRRRCVLGRAVLTVVTAETIGPGSWAQSAVSHCLSGCSGLRGCQSVNLFNLSLRELFAIAEDIFLVPFWGFRKCHSRQTLAVRKGHFFYSL